MFRRYAAAADSVSSMRLLICLVVLSFAAAAAAAPTPRPPRPYEPVAITRAEPSQDKSFIAFRAELVATAKSRVYARLAALVSRHDFFWDRDFGRHLDPRKPAVDNLAQALALEHDDGAGWDKLAEFAEEAAVEPLASRPGVVCAPSRPTYDGVAYSRLLDKSYTGPMDWAYPRADNTTVRADPKPDAAAIGTIGAAFVRLVGFAGSDSEPDPGRKLWAQVAMPDGKVGFVAPGSLMPLTAEQLCYVRDPVGGWRIVGFVAGGN